jgi:hypothetical protein
MLANANELLIEVGLLALPYSYFLLLKQMDIEEAVAVLSCFC